MVPKLFEPLRFHYKKDLYLSHWTKFYSIIINKLSLEEKEPTFSLPTPCGLKNPSTTKKENENSEQKLYC